MGDWIETYRGTVYRWEVDNADHFTVAYYFQRFEDATAAALAAIGLDGPEGLAWRPAECRVRYRKELRVGDILHIRSGVIEVGERSLVLGHQVFNTASGDLCTTVEMRMELPGTDGGRAGLSAARRRAAGALRIEWDGEPAEGRSAPPGLAAGDAGLVDSARDTVKPWEIGVAGRAALPAYIHRFSAANAHVLAAFGLTPAYFRDERRGYSTFEFRMRFGTPLGAGDLVRVQSAVLHVGTSSVRLGHRMTVGAGGDLAAVLEQSGVHLDLEARRPAAVPAALRERALAMLAPVAAPERPGT